jgi:hypothetical protein
MYKLNPHWRRRRRLGRNGRYTYGPRPMIVDYASQVEMRYKVVGWVGFVQKARRKGRKDLEIFCVNFTLSEAKRSPAQPSPLNYLATSVFLGSFS